MGEQVTDVTYVLLRHRGRAAESGAAGASGVQTLVGALHDEFADELRQRFEHVQDQAAFGENDTVWG
ncbi:hypothetical protein [Streptomyces sp900116325]|uniref:hypothetical protein n=1 Tax=Streptomyces sp. 900116325 TaxID=3154295 RepID=UPI0033B43363